ncbi:MAG TPA: AraC family transcriptional regulator [Polyangiaceae bacterium]|nr:AraC family transcriptional regulator [Polyangiaceae bacterium]
MSAKPTLPKVHVVHCENDGELIVKVTARTTLWVMGEGDLCFELRGTQRLQAADAAVESVRTASAPEPNALRLAAGDARVREAVRLMQAAPEKRWTLRELARAVGVSRAVFAKVFKALIGEAPMAFLTRIRLERARSWLALSDAGLAEIASQSGYANEFAFSRAFRRHFGVAPGRLRRALRVRASSRPVAVGQMSLLCAA